MTRGSTPMTDFVFPILLMGCGLLGLVVINVLSQQQRAQARHRRPQAKPAGAASQRTGRVRVAPRPVTSPARVVPEASPPARRAVGPRVRPLVAAVALPARHRVSFGTGLARADDGELERLSRFLQAARAASGRVSVEAWGRGRKARRLARSRAQWVARQIGALGVPTAQVAEPKLSKDPAPAGAGEHTVLVVVRKR